MVPVLPLWRTLFESSTDGGCPLHSGVLHIAVKNSYFFIETMDSWSIPNIADKTATHYWKIRFYLWSSRKCVISSKTGYFKNHWTIIQTLSNAFFNTVSNLSSGFVTPWCELIKGLCWYQPILVYKLTSCTALFTPCRRLFM